MYQQHGALILIILINNLKPVHNYVVLINMWIKNKKVVLTIVMLDSMLDKQWFVKIIIKICHNLWWWWMLLCLFNLLKYMLLLNLIKVSLGCKIISTFIQLQI